MERVLKLIAKCRQVCYTEFMDLKKLSGKRICVAISGGADSVALLHYLKGQGEAFGFTVCAAHCEHGIRGEESLADMAFVQEFCAGLGVPLYLFQDDCIARASREKKSLETAAREFRYESLFSLIEQGKADYIATAHHLGDEAETVLFRIARGAALSGAVGMKEENGRLIRPFLEWTKKDILAYAQMHSLAYRVDCTNADVAFTRNKIRLEVLPKLEECVSGAAENIARFALRAAEDDALLYEYAKDLLSVQVDEAGAENYLAAFCDKFPLFSRACLLALKGLGVEKDYTSAHLRQAFDLQEKERGAKTDMPQGVEGVKMEKGVLFRLKKERIGVELPPAQAFHLDGFDGGRYEVILSKTPILPAQDGWRVLRADLDKIPKAAVFRFRKDGDEMRVFGGGTKSLKKLFNEKKIDVEARAYLPLIAEADGEVYAVCGVEISEKLRVDESTKNAVYIAIKRK